ncbi:S-layer homology domain-containing protein [Sporohalobacter salinus]|uniref:S-layer homology domain-containing protein n=1 Tax=Sporohalobacter salinus TaxID=1494606 RepID=UPI0019619D32|nr:S-layer homology domain-containing protein [Sporohalobacter salinus]MBM7622942.1 hypothetical protein [Sporohalobacter salinus]
MKKLALLLTVTMILTIAVPALAANPFTDVPAGHWAYDAISQVAEMGIMKGTPQGEFNGNKKLTRYRMAVITARIVSTLEKRKSELDKDQEQKLRKIANRLKSEFDQELELIKSDIKSLKKKTNDNRNLSITAIVLSIIAAVASN